MLHVENACLVISHHHFINFTYYVHSQAINYTLSLINHRIKETKYTQLWFSVQWCKNLTESSCIYKFDQ